MQIAQSSTFLQSVLQQLRAGNLAPAAFQRGYVWSSSDVLAFIESVLRQYPLGGFLFWTPGTSVDWSRRLPGEASGSRLGPIMATANNNRMSLLLDGQNRLATLAWLARDLSDPLPEGLSGAELETWGSGKVIVADLELQRFLFVPVTEAENGLRLPASAILNSRLINRHVRLRWDKEWAMYSEEMKGAGLDWADACARAFDGARVVITNLENATAAEAKDAFLHICKVGVPMSEGDFDAAVAWGEPA